MSRRFGPEFSPITVHEQVDALLDHERPLTILDVGCGLESPLQPLRGAHFRIVGLDISEPVVEQARRSGAFDDYVCGDFRATDLPRVDVVAMFDFIEHFEKDEGYDVLRRAEELTSKFVVVMTPTGFVPQGPEYGNEFQRHRSGWFPEDFIGRGYTVEGCRRFRPLYTYGATPRWKLPAYGRLNSALFALTRARSHPSRAFFMLAVKDVRGVPARWTVSSRPG